MSSLDQYTGLFCKINTAGYGTNFNKFFICYLYTRHLKQRLYLCDTSSNLSQTYHLILDSFQPLLDLSYANKEGLNILNDKDEVLELNKFLLSLSDDEICSQARSTFRWSNHVKEKIDTTLSQVKHTFDLGIHIRMGDKITSGEMASIPLERYIEEIKRNISSGSVYVMTDSSLVVPRLQDLTDSFTFYSLPPPIESATGHDQSEFNKRSVNDKMASYYHFLTELHIMQRCPFIVCTYSSNIGRFLYMTRETGVKIKSLDVPVFTILHDMRYYISKAVTQSRSSPHQAPLTPHPPQA
jgi:hypothetical protein